ncbi:hypothetical protein P4H42_03605 [Paenibacillus macerans]|uniref:hypothetical protein n=1 Tax=Paenibacillus macerans TaxID=44252 RepID=UPI002DBD3452|nr:hypothetical protein [Paenibacillus macerans]MEC0328708.1 hypothetical protein [Paenibacillus macerans]
MRSLSGPAYDYKAEFHDAVTDLIAEGIADRGERMAAVHALTEAYFDSVGTAPDAAEIERLADYVLREELTDTNPHKVAHAEYPFMGEWQLGRRRDREVSLWVAEAVGADGVDHKPKKRRMRSKHEHAWMDRGIRIKNAVRKAQYRRDTAPGPVINGSSASFTQCTGIGAKWRAFAVSGREEIVREAEDSAELSAA